MSAGGISKKLLEVMGNYDLIILNFASPDMLGHPGTIEKTILSFEFVDPQINIIWDQMTAVFGPVFLSSSHGNAESMFVEKGIIVAAHATNLVRFGCTGKNILRKRSGNLSNIASSILQYIMLDIPREVTSNSLLVVNK